MNFFTNSINDAELDIKTRLQTVQSELQSTKQRITEEWSNKAVFENMKLRLNKEKVSNVIK
jgi:hypothetical protein